MKNNELSVTEKRDLKKIEERISAGLATFLDVGRALVEVRDKKLYRQGHKTFEKYCKSRWDMSKTRAYQLIEAVDVSDDLSTFVDECEIPNKETHLRELAKADSESLPEVMEKASEIAEEKGIEKPTAEVFKQAVKEVCEPDTEPEVEEDDIRGAEPGETLWRNADVDFYRKSISALIKNIKEAPETPGYEMLKGRTQRILRDLDNAKNTIASCVPYEVCPYCCGFSEECVGCEERGWVSKQDFNLAPKDKQDAVKKLSGGGSK